MDWYDADPARQVVNERIDSLIDTILEKYAAAWPDKQVSIWS